MVFLFFLVQLGVSLEKTPGWGGEEIPVKVGLPDGKVGD